MVSFSPARAADPNSLGVHILHPEEIEAVAKAFPVSENSDNWRYLTLPLTPQEATRQEAWQTFMNLAKEHKFIPLIRLTSNFENGVWQRPSRKQIIEEINFLADLTWPTEEKHIIAFNEVNHAGEWGGVINPQSYAQTLHFVVDWAHTENQNFVVLPAGLDLAAPQGGSTVDAFWFWQQVAVADPEVLNLIDGWTSHSYPNPGFSSSPLASGRNSVWGFAHELAYVKQLTGRDLPVYITETGWTVNNQTARWLASYYHHSLTQVWSDPRVKAVTPFVFKGAPGPFAAFSFMDENDQPTANLEALKLALGQINQKYLSLAN